MWFIRCVAVLLVATPLLVHGEVRIIFESTDFTQQLVTNPVSGQVYAVSATSGVVRVINPLTEEVSSFTIPCYSANDVAFSPDGARMAVAAGVTGICIVDLASRVTTEILQDPNRNFVKSVAFATGNRIIYSVHDSSTERNYLRMIDRSVSPPAFSTLNYIVGDVPIKLRTDREGRNLMAGFVGGYRIYFLDLNRPAPLLPFWYTEINAGITGLAVKRDFSAAYFSATFLELMDNSRVPRESSLHVSSLSARTTSFVAHTRLVRMSSPSLDAFDTTLCYVQGDTSWSLKCHDVESGTVVLDQALGLAFDPIESYYSFPQIVNEVAVTNDGRKAFVATRKDIAFSRVPITVMAVDIREPLPIPTPTVTPTVTAVPSLTPQVQPTATHTPSSPEIPTEVPVTPTANKREMAYTFSDPAAEKNGKKCNISARISADGRKAHGMTAHLMLAKSKEVIATAPLVNGKVKFRVKMKRVQKKKLRIAMSEAAWSKKFECP